jgi:hypothetical protein
VTTYAVVVKGETSTGVIAAEVVVLTGQTPVTTTNTYSKVLAITKSGDFNGTLTITVGSTEILSLLPWEMGRQYRIIHLYGNITGNKTITYRFYRQPLWLLNDYDIPNIPSPYSQVLVWDTLILLAGGYLSDVSPQQIEMWNNQKNAWDLSLMSYDMEGQTLQAFPQFVRSLRAE